MSDNSQNNNMDKTQNIENKLDTQSPEVQKIESNTQTPPKSTKEIALIILSVSIVILITVAGIMYPIVYRNSNNQSAVKSSEIVKSIVSPLVADPNSKLAISDKCDLAIKYPNIYTRLGGASESETSVSFTIPSKNTAEWTSGLNISCSTQTKKLFNATRDTTFKEIKKTDIPLFTQASLELISETDKINNYTLPLKITNKVEINGSVNEIIYYQFLAKNKTLYTFWYKGSDSFEIQFNSLNPSKEVDYQMEAPSSSSYSSYPSQSSNSSLPPLCGTNSSSPYSCTAKPPISSTLKTYTNQFIPFFQLVYDDSLWKLEESTNELALTSVTLTNNDNYLKITLNPFEEKCLNGDILDINPKPIKTEVFDNGMKRVELKAKSSDKIYSIYSKNDIPSCGFYDKIRLNGNRYYYLSVTTGNNKTSDTNTNNLPASEILGSYNQIISQSSFN